MFLKQLNRWDETHNARRPVKHLKTGEPVRQTDRQTDRQTERQVDREIDSEKDCQTDRH